VNRSVDPEIGGSVNYGDLYDDSRYTISHVVQEEPVKINIYLYDDSQYTIYSSSVSISWMRIDINLPPT
jgi:hypothetical protein